MKGNIICNCKGKYRLGKNCQTAYLISAPLPVITAGSSHNIQVLTNPLKTADLIITSSTMNISRTITLDRYTVSLSFPVKFSTVGLHVMSFFVLSSESYIKPDDTIFVVEPRGSKRESTNYFTKHGLQNGYLGVGCCQNEISILAEQCISNITLHSTCQWMTTNDTHTTNGVVFISVSSMYLPLSIVGLQFNQRRRFSPSIYIRSSTLPATCKTCERGTLPCLTSQSSFAFTPKITKDILNYNSLLTTFLDKTRKFIPPWLSITVRPDKTLTYSKLDYSAFVGTAHELNKVVGCHQLNFPNSKSLIYAIRTTLSLLLTINSSHVFLFPTDSDPFCIAVDMCSEESTTLYVTLPSELQPLALKEITSLKNILDDNGQFSFENISFQENGIRVNFDSSFFNGFKFIKPKLPRYEFKLHCILSKSFTSSQLIVGMDFNGAILHNSSISMGEVSDIVRRYLLRLNNYRSQV